jgi:DNA-binding IclR family transcriptional regulator
MPVAPKDEKKPYYKIASLEKGLKIIELLSDNGSLSVSEVAKRLNQNRSASHRFLATLKELGYVIQDSNARYKLSLKMFELGNKISDVKAIRSISRPYMHELVTKYHETVNLGHLEYTDVTTIETVSSKEAIKFDSVIGERSPAHTLAMGKAMMAYMSQEEKNRCLDNIKFLALTKKTITSRAKFEKELNIVHGQGYAIDDEEWAIGLRCVATPIFNFEAHSDYAISISGPLQRMTSEKIHLICEDLKHICQLISKKLQPAR